MVKEIEIRVDYTQAVQVIRGLEPALRAHIGEHFMDIGEAIADHAQTIVPVDTGSLRKSIRVVQERGLGGWPVVKVIAGGGGVINPKTKREVDYAIPVEARHPYMAPALEAQRPKLERGWGLVVERAKVMF